jgi:2-polyprenyl-6-methoxyphenol hydroxylase-like FAD-dependent oxidoreductase
VEKLDEPVRESKALAVNPRTLEILEGTGLTKRMREIGLPIRAALLHRRGRVVASISFSGIHHRYPFMLALSQATTERLLAQAVKEAGGQIERGVELIDCQALPGRVEATLEWSGHQEIATCPWLFAADGARSAVREKLGNPFLGSSLAEEWHLADAPLRTGLAADQGHIILREKGIFLFLIRVVDETLSDRFSGTLWRVICNRPEPLSQLESAEQTGPPVWTSSFHISHRICSQLAIGNVYFGGDTAHIHSPMGARGMNLGLEDAWVFAELVRMNRLSEYNELRRPVDAQVVRQVDLLTRFITAKSPIIRVMRQYVFPAATKIPAFRRRMIATLAGLDHDLPQFAGTHTSSTPVAV